MQLNHTFNVLRELKDPEVVDLDMRRWYMECQLASKPGKPRVYYYYDQNKIMMDIIHLINGSHHFWAFGRK
jgi:hypothetical protein